MSHPHQPSPTDWRPSSPRAKNAQPSLQATRARRTSRRVLTTVIALALPLSAHLVTPTTGVFATLPVASAGPDHDKLLLDRGHVDAPKLFWDSAAKNFTIGAKADRADGKAIDTMVSHLRPTYYGRTDSGSSTKGQSYIAYVPEAEHLKFLGDAHTPLYIGYASPQNAREMFWQGLGAETDIPIEDFRNGSFSLDFLRIDGPGQMEIFQGLLEDQDEYAAPIRRMVSSEDLAYRVVPMYPGFHSHPTTTFSKPGRYEVTLRGSARDKDNNLITSEPTTFVYQVGATSPDATGLGDPREAWDNAKSEGNFFSAPRFEITKFSRTKDSSRDAANDEELLSTLHFFSGNALDSGHVAFYINGYYLGEAKVKAGNAELTEMLGNGISTYQAVFIPSDTSPSPRWVSAPLEYDRARDKESTSEAGDFPEPTAAQRNAELPTAEFTPTALGVEVRTSEGSPIGDDFSSLTVNPADDSLVLQVTGGLYANPEAENPACELSFISSPTYRTHPIELDSCGGDKFLETGVLKLTVTPDARSTIGGSTIEEPLTGKTLTALKADFELGDGKAVLPKTDTAAATNGQAQPAPADAAASTEHIDTLATDAVTLTRGHIDITPVLTAEGVRLAIGDDTREHATGSVIRDPKQVTMLVPDHAKKVRKGRVAGHESYNFIGPEGTTFWYLPSDSASQTSHPWPGFSNEHLDRDKHPAYAFEVETESMPEDAKWWSYLSRGIRAQEPLIDYTGRKTWPAVQHQHMDWIFTKPGIYKLKMRAVPENTAEADKDRLATPWTTVTFQVGSEVVEPPTTKPSAAAKPSASKPAAAAQKTESATAPKPSSAAPKPSAAAAKPSAAAAPSKPAATSPAATNTDTESEASSLKKQVAAIIAGLTAAGGLAGAAPVAPKPAAQQNQPNQQSPQTALDRRPAADGTPATTKPAQVTPQQDATPAPKPNRPQPSFFERVLTGVGTLVGTALAVIGLYNAVTWIASFLFPR